MSLVKKQIKDFVLNPNPQDDAQFILQTSAGVTQKTTKTALLNNTNAALQGLQTQIDNITTSDVIGGMLILSSGVSVYKIVHAEITIDSNPVCTLISSFSEDNVSLMPSLIVKNVINGSFEVELSNDMLDSSYKLSWLALPVSTTSTESSIDTSVHLWNPEYSVGDHLLYAFLNDTDDIDKGAIVTLNNIKQGNTLINNSHCIAQITKGTIRKANYFDIDSASLTNCSIDTETFDNHFEHRYINLNDDAGVIEWDMNDTIKGMDILQVIISNKISQGDIDIYAFNGMVEEKIGTIETSLRSEDRPSVIFEAELDRSLYPNEKLRLKRVGGDIKVSHVNLVHSFNPPRDGDKRCLLLGNNIVNSFSDSIQQRHGNLFFDEKDEYTAGSITMISTLNLAQLGDTIVSIGGLEYQNFDGNSGGWLNNTSTLSPSKGYNINQTNVSWTIGHNLSDDGLALLGEENIIFTLSSEGIKWDVDFTIYGGVDTEKSFINSFPIKETKDILEFNFGVVDYSLETGELVFSEEVEYIFDGDFRYDNSNMPSYDRMIIEANTNFMNRISTEMTFPSTTISNIDVSFSGSINIGSKNSFSI
jgi:hypothetical protein